MKNSYEKTPPLQKIHQPTPAGRWWFCSCRCGAPSSQHLDIHHHRLVACGGVLVGSWGDTTRASRCLQDEEQERSGATKDPSIHASTSPSKMGWKMDGRRKVSRHSCHSCHPPQKKLDTQNVPQLLFIHPPTLLIFGPEFCWLFGNFLKKPRQPTKNNMPSFTFKAVFSQFLFGIS